MNKPSERIEKLIKDLTLEEKVSLLGGATMWLTNPVDRLGIPVIKVTDGPNGARGEGLFGVGQTAACFPAGIGLAATWNTALVEQVGQALGEEAHTKGAAVLLAPTVNIHRSPVNGRNFECFSEDPFLAARMAVAYIRGVQSRGVATTVKHFVCNDSEFERNTISSEVSERPLREIYLPPFEAAVKEGGTWGLMSSYNRINGTYACDHAELLTKILREEWGYDGIVVSDWFGTKSTAEAANAGLDLEMPGPTLWRGARLLQAVQAGEVSTAVIDAAAARILTLYERVGAFDSPAVFAENAVIRPEHNAVARQAAAEGIVLLKNRNGLLPLDPKKLKKIALIGPNARTAQIMGGGSAEVNAHYAVTPYQGITAQLGQEVEVGYALGCTNFKFTPRLDTARMALAPGSAEQGFRIEYYNNLDLAGEPAWVTSQPTSEQVWMGEVGPGVAPRAFSARISGIYTPEESGQMAFGLASSGCCRLLVDGKLVIDNWTCQEKGESFMGMGSAEQTVVLSVTAGLPLNLVMEYSKQDAGMIAGVRLGGAILPPADALQQAAVLARQAEVVLLFVGTNGEWESEGADKSDLSLPGQQTALVEAVTAANPNTVVVLQTGSPVVMPWLERAGAVLQAWFPGQECGNAIADVVFGKLDASGRLSQTFPMRLEDNPAYINYPGENGKVHYGEGIFVGYRYYEKKKVVPLFPFGFGLSYTSFSYSNLRLSRAALVPGETLDVSVDVTNTGPRAGMEVVQLYVRDERSKVQRPEKELKGFTKIQLQPGETRTVSFQVDQKALAFFDDSQHCWMAEAGVFQVLLGSSSQQIRAAAAFTLSGAVKFGGRPQSARRLTLDSTVKELLANEAAMAVIERHIPGASMSAQAEMAQSFSLRQLSTFEPNVFNETVLQAIAADLEKI